MKLKQELQFIGERATVQDVYEGGREGGREDGRKDGREVNTRSTPVCPYQSRTLTR